MSRKSRNSSPQPERFWTPMRIGLIGAALVLGAIVSSVVFRSNTQVMKSETNSSGKPAPAATIAAATPNTSNKPVTPVVVPAIVMETSFHTLNGKSRRLKDYAGKVLVVDIWATWCGPCRIEIPHLVELAKEFKGRGVEVVGLTTEDPARDSEKVHEFAKQFNINYPLGFANGEFAQWLQQGRDVIPQTYVIGRDGRLRKHFIGFNAQTSPPQLRAAVEEAVGVE